MNIDCEWYFWRGKFIHGTLIRPGRCYCDWIESCSMKRCSIFYTELSFTPIAETEWKSIRLSRSCHARWICVLWIWSSFALVVFGARSSVMKNHGVWTSDPVDSVSDDGYWVTESSFKKLSLRLPVGIEAGSFKLFSTLLNSMTALPGSFFLTDFAISVRVRVEGHWNRIVATDVNLTELAPIFLGSPWTLMVLFRQTTPPKNIATNYASLLST